MGFLRSLRSQRKRLLRYIQGLSHPHSPKVVTVREVEAALCNLDRRNEHLRQNIFYTACINPGAFVHESYLARNRPICGDFDLYTRGRSVCRGCHICLIRALLTEKILEIADRRDEVTIQGRRAMVADWLLKSFGEDDRLWLGAWTEYVLAHQGTDIPLLENVVYLELGEWVEQRIIWEMMLLDDEPPCEEIAHPGSIGNSEEELPKEAQIESYYCPTKAWWKLL